MREIIFRGKLLNSGDWLYGVPLEERSGRVMLYTQDESGYVDPATVGQYTGLNDRNGVKIFEGDILQYTFDDIGMQKAIIKYSEEWHTFLMVPLSDFQYAEIGSGTIVGNVWDNPELLEGDGHE